MLPHTLRHSFAKNMIDAGTPLDQIATLLGHENLDTTRIKHSQVSEIWSGLYDVLQERLFKKTVKVAFNNLDS